MLDTSTAKKAPKFIRGIQDVQDTDQTIRVAAVISRHKETPGEYDWLRKGPSTLPTDNETSEENTKLDWQLTKTPALAALKELANHAVEETEKRYRQESLTMAIFETLASGGDISGIPLEEDPNATREAGAIAMLSMPSTQFSPEEIDIQETRYELPSMPKSDSGSRRAPTKYQNATLSPYMLLISCIIENRRYVGEDVLPSNLYVSDILMWQLHKDMKLCINEEFNGRSIPFMLLDGKKVDIPVLSAKHELGVDLPIDMVWCSNGMTP